MHEFTTAQSIINTIKRIINAEKIKELHRVELVVGELTFLETEQLSFWIREGLKEKFSPEIAIEVIEPKIRCEECNYQGKMKIRDDPVFHLSLPTFACPKCQGDKIKIITGRECFLKSIVVD